MHDLLPNTANRARSTSEYLPPGRDFSGGEVDFFSPNSSLGHLRQERKVEYEGLSVLMDFIRFDCRWKHVLVASSETLLLGSPGYWVWESVAW
jgi:hypothetical protein